MSDLVISKEGFTEVMLGIIKSGVAFTAREMENGDIHIIFTGGY
jgi:hypothetical protein